MVKELVSVFYCDREEVEYNGLVDINGLKWQIRSFDCWPRVILYQQ